MGELNGIRTADLEDELHYSLWDAVRALGYSSYVVAHRKIPRAARKRVPWEVFGETGPRARTLTTAVTEVGLKYLVAHSKRASARDLAAKLGMELVVVPTQESEVLRIVTAALKPIEVVEEYKVGSYVVDAYCPGLGVVIEYDRLSDPRFDREAEFWRRVIIEDQLGCAFVTFDPKRRDFNPGDVINKILTMELPKRAEQSA
ncbi:putative protein OS=Streptomyces aurantiogriseus OX=66870 GN=GCM10010251_45060 PE=4 SV=1 [Streptomyces aurantiogriseus]|uniref:Uncharacterized protein n=2 Tax=Streptomyces aurantiogriseus TaxID=66870 RepID=A0A918CHD1_9ACTN|nr:hypothetical protein GCM10010251_45060 [Streptomyces aurantiogriseus]